MPLSTPAIAKTLVAGLAASAVVRLEATQIETLRKVPGPRTLVPLPMSVLKHCDEQTLTALVAVDRALSESEWGQSQPALHDWGIVAGARFLGHSAMGQAVTRFHEEGAWGVSPHLIPSRSLHALSGTVSQAWHVHGPNFGTGGGPHSDIDTLLAAYALLAGNHVPGAWLILSRTLPESTCCEAIALALINISHFSTPIRLEWTCVPPLPEQVRPFDQSTLADMLHTLDAHSSVTVAVGDVGWLRLRRVALCLPEADAWRDRAIRSSCASAGRRMS